MIKYLDSHEINDTNRELLVFSTDEKRFGAHHVYSITERGGRLLSIIKFQEGPIKEHGVNGVTNEALLAIVADRLACFQDTKFACPENEQALEGVMGALRALHARTQKRVDRGVEGTNDV